VYNLYRLRSWSGGTKPSQNTTFMLKGEDTSGNKSTIQTWTHGANNISQSVWITETAVTFKRLWIELQGDNAYGMRGLSVTLSFINTDSSCNIVMEP
jgi:hypothetical protein